MENLRCRNHESGIKGLYKFIKINAKKEVEHMNRRMLFTDIAIALLDAELLNTHDSICEKDLIDECADVIEKRLSDFYLIQGEIY